MSYVLIAPEAQRLDLSSSDKTLEANHLNFRCFRVATKSRYQQNTGSDTLCRNFYLKMKSSCCALASFVSISMRSCRSYESNSPARFRGHGTRKYSLRYHRTPGCLHDRRNGSWKSFWIRSSDHTNASEFIPTRIQPRFGCVRPIWHRLFRTMAIRSPISCSDFPVNRSVRESQCLSPTILRNQNGVVIPS